MALVRLEPVLLLAAATARFFLFAYAAVNYLVSKLLNNVMYLLGNENSSQSSSAYF